MIRITSKKDGFRRCNVAHSREAIEHPADKFSAKELKILKAEPMLVVTETAETKAPEHATQAEIIEAIAKLDKDNKAHWTGDNKPQVAAIEKVLGSNISAKDRDAAWELYSSKAAGGSK